MLALLAAATLSTSSVPATPQVTVMFPNAISVTVTGPENTAQNAEYPWTHAQTLRSPRGNAAAVRFCWEIGKYDGCRVYLARPGRPALSLKNSTVKRLLWTGDGQFLIGAGENTVRLWNLSGRMRTAVPTAGSVFARLTRHSSHIVGLALLGRDLCVRTEDQWYDQNGQPADRSVSTTRYVLPTLKPLETISQPVQAGQEAPCHLPHTEP